MTAYVNLTSPAPHAHTRPRQCHAPSSQARLHPQQQLNTLLIIKSIPEGGGAGQGCAEGNKCIIFRLLCFICDSFGDVAPLPSGPFIAVQRKQRQQQQQPQQLEAQKAFQNYIILI